MAWSLDCSFDLLGRWFPSPLLFICVLCVLPCALGVPFICLYLFMSLLHKLTIFVL